MTRGVETSFPDVYLRFKLSQTPGTSISRNLCVTPDSSFSRSLFHRARFIPARGGSPGKKLRIELSSPQLFSSEQGSSPSIRSSFPRRGARGAFIGPQELIATLGGPDSSALIYPDRRNDKSAGGPVYLPVKGSKRNIGNVLAPVT